MKGNRSVIVRTGRLAAIGVFAAALVLCASVFVYSDEIAADELPDGETLTGEVSCDAAQDDISGDLTTEESQPGEPQTEESQPGEPQGEETSSEETPEDDEQAAEGGAETGIPDETDAGDTRLTGFVTEDGVTHYYDENGEMLILSWITEPETGKRFFALEDGTIASGRFIVFGEEIYYALEGGEIASGIFSASGIVYYADPETLALKREPGWVGTPDGNTYYILQGGRAATGFLYSGGTVYYMDGMGRLVTGFFEAEGNLRYSDPETGAVVTGAGWLYAMGERYYSDRNGWFIRNRFISFGDSGFFMGSDGHVIRSAAEIFDQYGLFYVVKDETGELPLGWYTDAEGNRYFQKRDGALRGDVTMDHRKYRFDKDTGKLVSMVGIDVSEWQGNIDWNRVAADGIEFAFIRIGGRGAGNGAIYDDDNAAENIRGATAAGLSVGVYFFTQAVSTAEAREEARYVLNKIKGYDIALPIVIDTEELFGGGRHNYLSPAARTAIVLAFCDEVIKAGRTPMVYASSSYYEDWWLLDSQLGNIPHWVAEIFRYPDEHNACDYGGDTACWQYSWEGDVDGIDYDVDMNIWYLDVYDPWTPELS